MTVVDRNRFWTGRHAGLLVPLFSIPSSRSWGIGEITDIPVLAAWMRTACLDFLQILPVNELPSGERSPYSAMTAMAIDPIYIGVHAVEDFQALGREAATNGQLRSDLTGLRRAPGVDYVSVRSLKMRALSRAFDEFVRTEWHTGTARASALRAYIDRQAWWIEDYALFRALHAWHEGRPWTTWEPPLRDRRPAAVEAARCTHAREILFYEYVQWIADAQWQDARRAAGSVGLFGDLAFSVATNSADVWSRPHDFRLDAFVGTPPDAFSPTGQDWGLPAYRWDAMRAGGFSWLACRAERAAGLVDGYRIDHLVGFYRSFVKPHDGAEPYFDPETEVDQIALGERVIEILRRAGAYVTAEDLGTVPDFVRASLARLGVPGYKVLRWERQWGAPSQPFRDPAAYPPVSVATTGTHDTEPLASWWDALPHEERLTFARSSSFFERSFDHAPVSFGPETRDAVLEALFASGSDLLILPVQDLFGWRDRINVPGAAHHLNWTYRLPWLVDRLEEHVEARECALRSAEWAERYGRVS